MPRGFYATAIRAKRVGWLAGPFETEGEARENVAPARNLACELDPWCAFDAFGVTALERPDGRTLPPGVLNSRMGIGA